MEYMQCNLSTRPTKEVITFIEMVKDLITGLIKNEPTPLDLMRIIQLLRLNQSVSMRNTFVRLIMKRLEYALLDFIVISGLD